MSLLVPILRTEPRALKIARRDANRRQRSPQVVTQRCQQRRLEFLALAGQFSGLSFFEKLRSFDSDGDQPRERVERPGFDRPA